ncbi:MAG: hypothetical protein II008_05410 [Oscillospiraceae bacterium]|nr:hypothetical protein [Oscillospiraceae bacterium]
MALREIYKVFATQIVISESNPQGVLSDIPNFPKPFDSRNYKATAENPNGDGEVALLAAQAEFKNESLTLTMADSPSRVGWTVSIIRTSDGKEIDRKAWGGYPDMTPPEPEPEPETEEAQ